MRYTKTGYKSDQIIFSLKDQRNESLDRVFVSLADHPHIVLLRKRDFQLIVKYISLNYLKEEGSHDSVSHK